MKHLTDGGASDGGCRDAMTAWIVGVPGIRTVPDRVAPSSAAAKQSGPATALWMLLVLVAFALGGALRPQPAWAQCSCVGAACNLNPDPSTTPPAAPPPQ